MNILMLPIAVALFFSCGDNKVSKETSAISDHTPAVTTVKEKEQNSQSTITSEETTAVIEEITIKKAPEILKKKGKNKVNEVITAIEKTEEPTTETDTEVVIAISENKEVSKEVIEVEEVTIETEEEENMENSNIKKAVDHGPWNNLLKKYVNDLGNVDYTGFAQDVAPLNAYLETLAQNVPEESAPKNEKLAYYINLYNAATVKLIIDNYPTKSIKKIKSPWGKKIVSIGNEKISLGDIEHKILRKMNEPRIHFAINCASFSCPKLVNKAFTTDQMEQQLQAASIDFVNDTTRNIITTDKIQLSEIFKWYKKDFTEKGTSLKDYINTYAKTTISTNAKVSYLKYDWSLNEAK